MSGSESLLADYVQTGSERAFTELVQAYINFVYGIARRIVGGDSHLAEDISQTVFMDLARKAIMLPSNIKLGGWLHRHTCFVARKALRSERRRIARERRAVELQVINDYTEQNLGELSAVLDQAINDLGDADRHAIILRFFEDLDYRALGTALGSTEDAARMRVGRALSKMGALLKRRGVMVSAAGLSFVLAARTAHAAPAGLALKISHVAFEHALTSLSGFSLFRQVCFTKTNGGILTAAAAMGVAFLLVPSRPSGAAADSSAPNRTTTTTEQVVAENNSRLIASQQIQERPNQPEPVVVSPKQTVSTIVTREGAQPSPFPTSGPSTRSEPVLPLSATAPFNPEWNGWPAQPFFSTGAIKPVARLSPTPKLGPTTNSSPVLDPGLNSFAPSGASLSQGSTGFRSGIQIEKPSASERLTPRSRPANQSRTRNTNPN